MFFRRTIWIREKVHRNRCRYVPRRILVCVYRFYTPTLLYYANNHRKGPTFICGLDVIALKANSSEGCLVYSVGSNIDISFEVGIKKNMGCETLAFDPALNVSFVEGDGGRLYTDLSTEGEGMVGGASIETMLHELRHQNRTIDVMRFDCEVWFMFFIFLQLFMN